MLSVDISCLWNQVILSLDTEEKYPRSERRVVAAVPFCIGYIQIDSLAHSFYHVPRPLSQLSSMGFVSGGRENMRLLWP